MENVELYFLRSFEKEIAKEILYYAARLDETNQTLEDFPGLAAYLDHYGIYRTDVGIYAMIDNELAGAAWVRLLKEKGFGYIDDETPELVFGVKPKFRNQGVGTKIMEQLMHEVSMSFSQMGLAINSNNPAVTLYERLGFTKVEGSDYSHENGRSGFKMIKQLQKPAEQPYDDWFEKTKKWREPDR